MWDVPGREERKGEKERKGGQRDGKKIRELVKVKGKTEYNGRKVNIKKRRAEEWKESKRAGKSKGQDGI